jgi:hypothetical protein
MSVTKKIFIFLGLIIFIYLVILFGREFFVKKPERIIPLEETEKISNIKDEDNIDQEITLSYEKTSLTTETPSASNLILRKKPILLLDFPLLFPHLNYPQLNAYDPQSKTIRFFNIEDKSYKELYKDENLNYVLFSENGLWFFIKSKNNYYLIDTLKDKKYDLPYFTQKVYFYKDNPYLFVSLLNGNSYLAQLINGQEKKILDIFILNPDIDFLAEGIVIGENLKFTNSSPLYLKTSQQNTQIILSEKRYLIFITDKNNLIFVSYVDNQWKSLLIDSQGKLKKEFNFGTLKEKCSFGEFLICGVPESQDFSKIEDWYYLKHIFKDSLIIYNKQNDTFQEIKLDGNFDIIKPQITPLGIIFFNRTDSRLYFLSKDNLSF